jgi:hypothetical protein
MGNQVGEVKLELGIVASTAKQKICQLFQGRAGYPTCEP